MANLLVWPFLVGMFTLFVGCSHNVDERIPLPTSLAEEDAALAYVRELRQKNPEPMESWLSESPDGRMELVLVEDRTPLGGSGFVGIEIKDKGTGRSTPVMSLWEADPGSGVDTSVVWSSDSRALRLKGRTPGFKRGGWGGTSESISDFDFIYIVEEDRFVLTH